MDDEEAKRIQEERDKQLTEEYKELQNPKKPDYNKIINEVIPPDWDEIDPAMKGTDLIGELLTLGTAAATTAVAKPLVGALGVSNVIDAGINIITGESDTPFEKKLEIFKPAKVGAKGIRILNDMLTDVFDRRVEKADPVYAMSEQTERMATGFKENIDKIPKKNRATDAEFTISKVDEAAKVTKPRIKKLVNQFGGTSDDVDAIFQEQVVKMQSQLKAKAWLNKYFKDLTAGLGPDGLKNARIQNINGKPRLVDGRTKKTIDHAFEVDHQKAKELMADLDLEGADMHENLEIVYSVFNQKKNHIGNPALPDKLLEAVGQSTALKDFVQRRLDKAFDLNYQRVPQRFRDVAKVNLMDDILDAKPGVKLEVTIEKRLKFYDKFSKLLVQIDDYVPPKVQRQLDTVYRDLNPQEYLQQLKDLGVYDRLTGRLKHLHEKLSDDWINLKRGLRSRPTTKYMQEGHDV